MTAAKNTYIGDKNDCNAIFLQLNRTAEKNVRRYILIAFFKVFHFIEITALRQEPFIIDNGLFKSSLKATTC